MWEWGGEIAQTFRIAADHLPFWSLPKSIGGGDGAGYGQGTKEIIEWMGEHTTAHKLQSQHQNAYKAGVFSNTPPFADI